MRPLSRRHWLQGALAPALLAAVGGCVVAPQGTYYRPATAQPGARERRAWCQGAAGPVTGLDVDLGAGLQLRAWTDAPGPDGRPLRLALTVPRATALQFLGPLRLLDAGGNPIAVALAGSAQRSVDLATGAWVEPERLRPAMAARDPEAPHGRLTVQLEPLAGAAAPDIVVEGLAVEREGRRWVLPPVALARPASARRPWAYRSAQEQAAVRERAEACRRATPERACENIVEFSDASHAGQADGLRWRGAWSRRQQPAGDILDGELTLAVLDPGRWRLDDGAFRVRTGDGGPALALRAARARLAFDDAFPMQQPLPASEAETRVLLEARLPADQGSFDVQLPALLRNGARLEVAPLRFERRSVDFGVEPFNC